MALLPGIFLNAIYGADYISIHRFEFSIVLAGGLIALSAVFVFALARLQFLNQWKSMTLGLYAGLGTGFLTTGSRALWQQTGALLVTMVTLWSLEKWRARRSKGWLVFLGFLLGFAFMVRPTMLSLGFIIFLYLVCAEKELRATLTYCAPPGLAVLTLFSAQSMYLFGTWLPPYYLATLPESREPLSGIMATLFSPARGFFFWHPLFLFSGSIWPIIRGRGRRNCIHSFSFS